MKRILIPVCIAIMAGAFMATAQASPKSDHHMTKQQSRFATCAHESKGLKGKAHSEFMSKCLKGDDKAAAKIKAHAMKQGKKPKPPAR